MSAATTTSRPQTVQSQYQVNESSSIEGESLGTAKTLEFGSSDSSRAWELPFAAVQQADYLSGISPLTNEADTKKCHMECVSRSVY
jgi:hypothetical protein